MTAKKFGSQNQIQLVEHQNKTEPNHDNGKKQNLIFSHKSFLAVKTTDPELDFGKPPWKSKAHLCTGRGRRISCFKTMCGGGTYLLSAALIPSSITGTNPPQKNLAGAQSLQVGASSLCLQIHSLPKQNTRNQRNWNFR